MGAIDVAIRYDASNDKRRRSYLIVAAVIGLPIIGCVCVETGIHDAFRRVVVRAPDPSDLERTGARYFGFYSEDLQVRQVAVVTGTFTLDTRVVAILYTVRSGTIDELNAFDVGRSHNQVGSPVWQRLKLRLALGELHTPEGRITNLGCNGHSNGGGHTGPWPLPPINVVASKSYVGPLPTTPVLVYVEGDAPFEAARETTIAEFAATNSGNFLVVTAYRR